MKTVLLLSGLFIFTLSCKKNDGDLGSKPKNNIKTTNENSSKQGKKDKVLKKITPPVNKAPLLQKEIVVVGFSKKHLFFYDATGKVIKKTPIPETDGLLFSNIKLKKTWLLTNRKVYLIDPSRGTFHTLYTLPKEFNKCLKKGALNYMTPNYTIYYPTNNFGISKDFKGFCMKLDSYKRKTAVYGYAPFGSKKMVFTTIKDKTKKCAAAVGKKPCEIFDPEVVDDVNNPVAMIPEGKCYIKFTKSKKKIKLKKNEGECDWEEFGLSKSKKYTVYFGQTQAYAGTPSKNVKIIDLKKKKVVYDKFYISSERAILWSSSLDLLVYYNSDSEIFNMVIMGKKVTEVKLVDNVVLVK